MVHKMLQPFGLSLRLYFSTAMLLAVSAQMPQAHAIGPVVDVNQCVRDIEALDPLIEHYFSSQIIADNLGRVAWHQRQQGSNTPPRYETRAKEDFQIVQRYLLEDRLDDARIIIDRYLLPVERGLRLVEVARKARAGFSGLLTAVEGSRPGEILPLLGRIRTMAENLKLKMEAPDTYPDRERRAFQNLEWLLEVTLKIENLERISPEAIAEVEMGLANAVYWLRVFERSSEEQIGLRMGAYRIFKQALSDMLANRPIGSAGQGPETGESASDRGGLESFGAPVLELAADTTDTPSPTLATPPASAPLKSKIEQLVEITGWSAKTAARYPGINPIQPTLGDAEKFFSSSMAARNAFARVILSQERAYTALLFLRKMTIVEPIAKAIVTRGWRGAFKIIGNTLDDAQDLTFMTEVMAIVNLREEVNTFGVITYKPASLESKMSRLMGRYGNNMYGSPFLKAFAAFPSDDSLLLWEQMVGLADNTPRFKLMQKSMQEASDAAIKSGPKSFDVARISPLFFAAVTADVLLAVAGYYAFRGVGPDLVPNDLDELIEENLKQYKFKDEAQKSETREKIREQVMESIKAAPAPAPARAP